MNMDYAIEVIDVSKSFKDHTVLKNINLTVNKGEICGIIGRNGSGKTVLLKCICKIFLEDSGEIYILGENTTKNPSIIKNLGVLIETPAFLENFSGYWNLKFLADLSHKIGKKEVQAILRVVGLEEAQNKKVKNYSLGMKQRLAIAQTIMENQTILILDEPMNGLDKKGVSQMREIFLEYKKKGNSILMATHNPQDVEILCDHVYEMDDGVIERLY
ncbi:MAG: ATP-binding cassette domain-containing protein [Eubacterium sp.]|nr:ATP-binding cassette domain-containing protein [Eubacterium sp.]